MNATTDLESIFDDKEISAIVISTRHDSHGELVLKALKSGKHVFVEKPLCLTKNELLNIENTISNNQILMVGYNRRFAKLTKVLKEQIKHIKSPKSFIYTCNAGYIPGDHWTHNPKIGGGRLLGEACHFLDLLTFLCDEEIKKINLISCKDNKKMPDTFTLSIYFSGGSIGTINYFANGSKLFPKERLEVFTDNKIFQLNNFLLKIMGVKGFKISDTIEKIKDKLIVLINFEGNIPR